MPIFPLDSVRNAVIEQAIEPSLEEIRLQLSNFPFPESIGGTEAVLEAFDFARPRLNVLAALVRTMEGATGVDVSTGLGFLPVLFRHCGTDVIATERDVSIAAFASANGIDVLPYEIGGSRPPIPAGSLDFAVFAEVLEHLKLSPIPVLREIRSLLKPGGRLLLTTPNIARLQHVEALAAGENFLEPFPDDLSMSHDATDYVEHVREYSVREVVEAVEGAGLAMDGVRMTGWGRSGYEPLANPFANDIILAIAHN
jgi:2-polyprenyl-3-methyl-5-hydroxy-6-metoxy-1,4-benzoquinol methylase